ESEQLRITIAGSPRLNTSQTWLVLKQLVTDSLAVAHEIDMAQVVAELEAIAGAGMSLISGGHLSRSPVVLVAAELELSIEIVSGESALALNENLNVVPGAATATDWRLHLPSPAPLSADIEQAVNQLAHITTE